MGFKKVDIRKQQQENLAQTPCGRMALWYGRGKVALRGNLEIYNDDNYKNNDKYSVVLFEAKEEASYELSGFITIPNPQNAVPNKRPAERRYEPEERIGRIFYYSGHKKGDYTICYLDSGDAYVTAIQDNETDNPKAPAFTGAVRFMTPKESDDSKYQQKVKRLDVQRTQGAQKNPYFKKRFEDVVDSDFEQSKIDVLMQAIASLSGEEKEEPKKRIEKTATTVNEPEESEYEVVDSEEEFETEPEVVQVTNFIPSKKKRIAEVANVKPNVSIKVKGLSKRISDIGSEMVEGIDEEEII